MFILCYINWNIEISLKKMCNIYLYTYFIQIEIIEFNYIILHPLFINV